MRRRLRLLMAEDGQAAVETAIVVPTMMFFILGKLQTTMMHQARLMLEYAAFNAARSGAVWNMDRDKMKTAAMFSLLPTTRAVDTIPRLAQAGLNLAVANGVLGALGLPEIVTVDVLNPKEGAFSGKKEIEFDDPANREKTQLTVRVRYLYELRIPFANWLLFESWWASHTGVNLAGWEPGHAMVKQSKLMLNRWKNGDFSETCRYTGLNNQKMYLLRLAANAGRYFVPMTTTYTIRMQSNPFLHHPEDSSELWAGRNNDGC